MSQPIISLLETVGAVMQNDHFVYVSGTHGSVYINKDRLYPHTTFSSNVGKMFAEKARYRNIDVVAAPALGGIILSQWTAFHLTKLLKKEVLGIYTEKTSTNNQVFTRGYDALVRRKNVLVVEDITTTGESVAKVVRSVREAGGNVCSVMVMVNRDPDNVTMKVIGAPFESLGVLQTEAYDAVACPLCRNNIPINTTVGHGKQFLESKEAMK